LFARNAALQESVLFFFDVFQASVTQYVAVACGQAQWLEPGADAAQGIEFFEAAFLTRVGCLLG